MIAKSVNRTVGVLGRRKFLALLGISGLVAALHIRWLEPGWLGIGKHIVPLGKSRNPEPLKVLQLSDFHASRFVSLDFIAKSVQLGLSLNPVLSLLLHNPDTKDLLKAYAWDLLVCGHTHGGQFYLPLIGTPFAPVRDKRFVKGLHRWEDRWIHITKGVGNLLGVRFNCRPEVSLLTLA